MNGTYCSIRREANNSFPSISHMKRGVSLKIVVDADACPKAVLQLCLQKGNQYHVPVWTIASFNHNIMSDHHIIVGNASQETDLKVLNLTDGGDVIITQDWGLAAMVLGKGATCLSPDGREYESHTMDFMLEEREMKAKYRRSGGRTKGPKKRTDVDDQKFAASLERVLSQKKSPLRGNS
jgi:uncharacterized protein